MAVYCELNQVLHIIRNNAETLCDAQKDRLGEQLFSSENPGDDTTDLPLSSSLQYCEMHAKKKERIRRVNPTSNNESAKTQQQQQLKRATSKRFDKLNTVTSKSRRSGSDLIKKPPPLDAHLFPKEKITRSVCKMSPSSGLSSMRSSQNIPPISVAAASANTTSPLVTTPSKLLEIIIHISQGKPIQLQIREDAAVFDAIKAALKQAEAEHRNPSLRQDPGVYELHLAETDGKPDDDCPPLNLQSNIKMFGKHFALVENSSTDIPKKRRESETPPKNPRPLFKVHLPDDLKTLVTYQPEMKIGQLLAKICGKRGLEPTQYYITLTDSEIPISNDVTLDSIAVTEVMLRARVTAEATDDTTPFWREAKGTMPPVIKTFNILRLHRFVASEPMIVGISRGSFSFEKKKKGSKRHLRQIAEVTKVALGDKPKLFNVEFIDGTKNYEAETVDDAREIVGCMEDAINNAS